MQTSDAIVLHSDTRLVRIAELPDYIRNKIPQRTGEYVLSRSGARAGSMVLDEKGAHLIRLMKQGLSLPEALRKMAQESDRSPELVVKEAYPLIQVLLKEAYITHGRQEQSQAPGVSMQFRFTVGDTFGDYVIAKKVQLLEDTEVYKVTLKGGRSAALKLLRKRSSMVVKAFEREVEILRHLGGGFTPKLIDACLDGEDIYFVMEWIDGAPIHEWTIRVRALSHVEKYTELRRLCIELAKAYDWLHGLGVLHSDLYPKNVLVDRSGAVRLIDFGYSWCDSVNKKVGDPPRNNNAYFKAPDLAAAALADIRPLPSPSVASDVYSLGALMYLIIVSRMYVDFSLSKDEQLSQVVNAPMVPFAARGVGAWPDMEQLLADMLEKDPNKRIASIRECVERLGAIGVPEEYSKEEAYPATLHISYELSCSPMIAGFAEACDLPTFRAPSASINYGAAGVAYALLRTAAASNDHRLVYGMDRWLCNARYLMEVSPDGCFNQSLGVTAEVVGPYAPLHRAQGITLLDALNAHIRTDTFALRNACHHFVAGVHRKQAPLEFIFGKAGLLNAIQQLSYLMVENEPLTRVGHELAELMLTEIESYRSLPESPVKFVGFAHGWAGIFYSLLAWGRTYDATVIERILPFLRELADYRVKTSLGSFWPKRFDAPVEAGDSASWCNGTSGFVLLWTEAYLATGNKEWLQVTEEAALHTLTHNDGSISLCCGLAGRAYALGTLYRASGNIRWLSAARECVTRAKPDPAKCEGYPHSLFKGILGIELAAIELTRPDLLVFPTLASPFYGEALPCGPWAPELGSEGIPNTAPQTTTAA